MSCDASAMTRPNGSQRNDPPQNSRPVAGSGVAADVSGFVSHAIDYRDIDAVGDRVGALDRAPGIMLRLPELRFLRRDASRLPWDRKEIWAPCSAVSRAPSGIPLVPADQRAHAANAGVEGSKPRSPGVK